MKKKSSAHDNAAGYWLTRREAAEYLRISPTQFDRERKKGRFLPCGKSSMRRPLWIASELDAEIGLHNDHPADPIMALIDAN